MKLHTERRGVYRCVSVNALAQTMEDLASE